MAWGMLSTYRPGLGHRSPWSSGLGEEICILGWILSVVGQRRRMDSGWPDPAKTVISSYLSRLCPHQPLPQALLGTYCVLPSLFATVLNLQDIGDFVVILQDLTIFLRKQALYPYFHPVFLWFANDMNSLSWKGRVCVSWRSSGGLWSKKAFQCISKSGLCQGGLAEDTM